MRSFLIYTKDSKENILISLSRHDYVQAEDGTFIDGGQEDYIRTNGKIYKGSVDQLIPVLRKKVKWISVYDKEKNKLKVPIVRYIYQLEDDHLLNIVTHLNDTIRKWETKNQDDFANEFSNIQQIFLAEIIYRSLHKIYDKRIID